MVSMVCSAVKRANVRPQNVIRFMDVQREVMKEIKNTIALALCNHLIVKRFLNPDIIFFIWRKVAEFYV